MRQLQNLTISAGALTSENGAKIPASQIEVLRAGFSKPNRFAPGLRGRLTEQVEPALIDLATRRRSLNERGAKLATAKRNECEKLREVPPEFSSAVKNFTKELHSESVYKPKRMKLPSLFRGLLLGAGCAAPAATASTNATGPARHSQTNL